MACHHLVNAFAAKNLFEAKCALVNQRTVYRQKRTKSHSTGDSQSSISRDYYVSRPHTWWLVPENLKQFLDDVAPKLGITRPEDWYKYSKSNVLHKFGGSAVSKIFKERMCDVLNAAYPSHKWYPWEFVNTDRKWWSDKTNQRAFVDYLRRKLNHSSLEDMYELSWTEIKKNKGRYLLSHYSNIESMVMTLYPEHDWKPWLFASRHRHPTNMWRDPYFLRTFFEKIRKEEGYTSYEDFYDLTNSVISKYGGKALTAELSGLRNAIALAYPEHSWQPWKFHKVETGYWRDISNQRALVELIRLERGLLALDDLYQLTLELICEFGARALMHHYKDSVVHLLRTLYSHHDWKPWLFYRSHKNWWTSLENRKEFLEYIRQQEGWNKLEDLYKLSVDIIRKYKGNSILNIYSGSPVRIVQHLYPNHKWLMWKFQHVPLKFWDAKANQRQFLDWLKTDVLRLTSYEDMYTITSKQIKAHGGGQILRRYSSSAAIAITALYPEHKFLPWRFRSTPKQFWNNVANRRKYLEWLKQQQGWKSFEDMYELSTALISVDSSSLALLVSPYELVRSVYPEHPWEQWRFVKVPRGFWDDLNNQRDFLQHVARKRGVSLSELVESDIIRNGGLTLLTMYGGSIKNILQQLFPDKLLEEPTYRLRKQPVLSASLSKIYPKQDIQYNTRVSATFGTLSSVELDIYIPNKRIAFEYQGERHFFDLHVFGEMAVTYSRDLNKVAFCCLNDITLVEVPFWWDHSLTSLCEVQDKVVVLRTKSV